MLPLSRQPVLPVGVLLFILGMGNWLVSGNKVNEYAGRATSGNGVEDIAPLDDFEHLTARTNATLVGHLHPDVIDYTHPQAKLDFYTVVHSGGRGLAVVGLLLIGVTLLRLWREHRMRRAVAANPGDTVDG